MQNKKLTILIADDDEGDRKQIHRGLEQSGLAFECVETDSVAGALAACEKCGFDCALVDYRLPGKDGLAAVTALHERLPDMAIIMITGKGDEMVAVEAMKRGASDYIGKSQVNAQSIRRSIENAVQKAALRTIIARQQRELEIFSRVLVHDLKVPIHSALGFAGLIEESVREGQLANISLYSRKVVSGVRRMETLIDTLDRYTRAEEQVVFGPTDMREVMVDTLSALEHLIQERRARVTYGELPAVSGNPQLTQLLQNLIGNDIKYCEAETPAVQVAATPQESNIWLFSVKDNGIGISESHHQKVFEPFNRLHSAAKYQGTGLGLATCKKIVERHGGTIWCESNQGPGTTFFFTLRAA